MDAYKIETKVSSRATKLRLQFNALDQSFKLTAPSYATTYEIRSFLKRCEPWMLKQQNMNREISFTVLSHGSVISIMGKSLTIEFHEDVRAHFDITDDTILVYGSRSRHAQILENSLKDFAEKVFLQKSLIYATRLNRQLKSVTVRDQKTRWGSCNTQGNLSYSWRLIFAPLQVIEYICAHEVAHLVEMNHSDKFWSVVTSIIPDYQKPRKWLKKHGKELHLIRF